MSEKADPLPGLWSRTYHRLDYGIYTADASEGTGDRLELAVGQSYRTHPTGVGSQFPEGHGTVQMPLFWLTGVLADLERPLESFNRQQWGYSLQIF